MRRILPALTLVASVVASPARATDANLDPGFGNFGWTAFDPRPGFDTGNDVAVQTDGKIVIVGNEFSVRRFTATGTADPGFGIGGTVTTDVGDGGEATSVALQADGRIVVVGTGTIAPSVPCLGAARYDANGTLEGTFGAGGVVKINLVTGSSPHRVTGVAIDAAGRIVIAGYLTAFGTGSARIVRLLADGSRDSAFSVNGVATLPPL